MANLAFTFHCCDLGVSLVRKIISRHPHKKRAWWEIEALMHKHMLRHLGKDGDDRRRTMAAMVKVYHHIGQIPQYHSKELTGWLIIKSEKFPEAINTNLRYLLENDAPFSFEWLRKYVWAYFNPYWLDLEISFRDGMVIGTLSMTDQTLEEVVATMEAADR